MTAVLDRPVAAPPTSTPPGPRPAAPAPRAGIVGPTVATALAVFLASISVSPLIDDSAWVRPTLLAIAIVSAVGGLATWCRVPVFLIPILQAGALFAALVGTFTDVAPLGFVPSGDALSALRSVLSDGMSSVDQYAPPVPSTDGMSAVVALGVGCVAIVVFVLAVDLRMPVAAGAGLVAIYIVPSFVLDDGAPWWTFVATAIGWLVLLVSDERVGLVTWGRVLRRTDVSGPRSPLAGLSSAALRLGALGVVAAVAIPILVPALTDAVLGRTGSGVGTGSDSGGAPSTVGLDPFVKLRRDLIQQPDVVVMRYTTTATAPAYLRTVVLEDYKDERWTARRFSVDTAEPVTDDSPIDPITQVSGTPQQYSFTVDSYVNSYLPVPENAVGITGLNGNWYADKSTATIFGLAGTRTTRDGVYTAVAQAGAPTAAQLQAAVGTRAPDTEALRNASDVPAEVSATARQITATATTDYERALDLQEYFLKNFTYSTAAATDQGGTYLEQFLRDKSGYCQQFAATMALMARALGIPSRVVVGYTPGTLSSDNKTWVVKAADAHAWPELSFPGLGWVRFEPTPRSASQGGAVSVPNYATPNQPTVAPTTPPSTTVTPPRAGGKLGTLEERQSNGSPAVVDDAVTSTSADVWRVRAIGLLVLVGLVGAGVPAVVRWRRRRRRLSPTGSVEDAWDELRDTARDLGVPWSDSLTPRQAVTSVIDRHRLRGAVAEAATRLGRATERSRYAATPPSADGLSRDVTLVRAALLDRVERSTRVRAVLMPASLRRTQS